MKTVNKPFRKKDAMQLVTGQPVYMDDIIPQDCLIVKLLRSPHANAIVRSINTAVAKKVPGIEAIFTWEDVPQDARRYTQAGQTYPEASPYDRLLIDRHVRFVGDVVAIVAGKDEKCVDKALKLIKVDYEVLEAVLDFHTAKDNPILVHPEDNWESLAPVGADNKRNLCAHDACGSGDIDAVLAGCDVVIDHVYHTKACQQAMMETFRTYCSIDTYGRLNVLSSTQIVFHARRNIANALHIPKSMVRVSKPRIGGGFGAKQTAVSEVYPAFVTWMTKKPSKLIFSRVESQTASSPRHEMEMHVRLGATKDGIVKGIDLYTLSNTGAYGEHGPTTVGLSGHKSIPLYGKAEAFRFVSDVVYTNHMSAGAYRGYGATQGLFAVESAVNELAHKLNMDPIALRLKNTVQEGDVMPAYYGAVNTSCALDRCVLKVREMIDWEHKYPARDMGNGKIRAVGMGMAMQGSGISGMDVGSATLKLNDDGFYTLMIGAADMGTGCDTTLAQIIRMVSDAAATKAPIAKIADTVSGFFVPAVISIAVVTTLVWLLLGRDVGYALARGISVLVISCPCALGLATPVAIMVGNGLGAKNGILFKTAAALEEAGRTRIVALDKTGTITCGEPTVTDLLPAADVTETELLTLAAALEGRSEHPLARAVLAYAEEKQLELPSVTDFTALPGNGLTAKLEGKEIFGGNAAFIGAKVAIPAALQTQAAALAAQGKTPLFFGGAHRLLGVIAVADTIKEDSPQAIRELRNMGIRVVMLTGDNQRTAEAIGRQAGVDEVIAGVLPEGKEAVIRQLQKYGKVAMMSIPDVLKKKRWTSSLGKVTVRYICNPPTCW